MPSHQHETPGRDGVVGIPIYGIYADDDSMFDFAPNRTPGIEPRTGISEHVGSAVMDGFVASATLVADIASTKPVRTFVEVGTYLYDNWQDSLPDKGPRSEPIRSTIGKNALGLVILPLIPIGIGALAGHQVVKETISDRDSALRTKARGAKAFLENEARMFDRIILRNFTGGKND